MKTKTFNAEVLFSDETIIKVNRDDVKTLKRKSDLNDRKRIRLCTHRDIEDTIHEMLIVHPQNAYIHPHKHLNKTESFHVIEGTAEIIIFDDKGALIETISMGPYGTERNFYYRLSTPQFHTLYITSDYFVFHETTNGPFRKSDTLWAQWAPHETDAGAVNEFMNTIRSALVSRLGSLPPYRHV